MEPQQNDATGAAQTEILVGESLLSQIGVKEAERKQLVEKGTKALLRQLLLDMQQAEQQAKEEGKPVERLGVTRAAVDRAIAAIDKQLGAHMDQILHHPKFKAVESSWRGLKYLVDNTNFRENIKISVLNVTKRELQDEFTKRPEIMKTGLYKHVYSAEYGVHGGKPFGAIIGNYEFGPGAQDIGLLYKLGSIAAMAHAPFLSAAQPQFFGIDGYRDLPDLKDLKGILEGATWTAWRGFRDSEESRYVGLTLPHFLLRLPYGKDNTIKKFTYSEDVTDTGQSDPGKGKARRIGHNEFLWGNAAFAFASRLTESFADYRWCANIIGPRGGGEVKQLKVHLYKSPKGDVVAKIPTEIMITDRREFELAEEGFIALTMRKDADNAAFFSANSCQRPKTFGNTPEGKAAETNFRLGTQLPYMFVISRLAHYIKVIQRENIGTYKERLDLEKELNKWISQYVSDQDDPQPGVRARRPIRQAKIAVEDVPGQPGVYKVDMKIRPHFKYMGADFTLSLVGKLDKK